MMSLQVSPLCLPVAFVACPAPAQRDAFCWSFVAALLIELVRCVHMTDQQVLHALSIR